ncbi:MAG: hypothetical protein AB8C02_15880 [Halioglobus sp.]
MWSFSTAVAYRNYIVPAFYGWLRDPENPKKITQRNDAMERFDRGAILEHIAFPIVLISGLGLLWIAGWEWQALNWLGAKLLIIGIIFIPMECVDYYISHGGGNKRSIRLAGDSLRYEQMIRFHWQFFRVTTPLVVTLIPLLFYLAIVKPI